MKIRNGFVSNSSSTSFTFIFKEDNLEDCFKVLEKHKDYFNLYDIETGASVDGDEIIAQMKSYIDEMYHIDNCLVEFEGRKQSYFEIIQGRGFGSDLFHRLYDNVQEKIEKMEELKEKGFKSFFRINFGDNHGDISGPPIGSAMDYEGRDIELKEDDVYMFTEQDR